MIISSKEAWQQRKKLHRVPSGVCKTVDMGDPFEAFARNAPSRYMSNPLQTLAAIEELAPKLTTYTAALKRAYPTNPILAELLAALKTLTSLKAQMSSAADPMRFLVQYHQEALRELDTLSRDRQNKIKSSHWDIFYRGAIRNIGLQLDKLCNLQPECIPVRDTWKREMHKVNAFMNQKGGLFQYALVEKTITTGLTQVQADLMRTGAWPVPRGQVPQPRPLTPPNYPAPEPPAPNYQAPLPPMRPDGLRKPLPKIPPRKF